MVKVIGKLSINRTRNSFGFEKPKDYTLGTFPNEKIAQEFIDLGIPWKVFRKYIEDLPFVVHMYDVQLRMEEVEKQKIIVGGNVNDKSNWNNKCK